MRRGDRLPLTQLQHSLDNLSNYCDNWQLAINVNKTKSMIFKQNYTKTEPSFVYYRNNQIQNVSEYTVRYNTEK